MANTDTAPCAPSGALLGISPFLGNKYHFGMLLGVDDFETEQAYHRGKMRLHNAWLHGEGVIWGYGVAVDTVKQGGEVRVEPGLALDAAGRELYLSAPACLNIAAWVTAHKTEQAFIDAVRQYNPAFVPPATKDEPLSGPVRFDAYVVLKYRACLTRQVPAVSTTCDTDQTSTAYSRVAEQVEILFLPGAPPRQSTAYHLVRLLFGLAAPDQEGGVNKPADDVVIARRQAILALPVAEQPQAFCDALRELAVSEGVAREPAETSDGSRLLLPAADDTTVLLAVLPGIEVSPLGVTTAGAVITKARPFLLPTGVLQELVIAPPVPTGVSAIADAGGPRVGSAVLSLDTTNPANISATVALTFTAAVEAGSLQGPGAGADDPFRTLYFDGQWHEVPHTVATVLAQPDQATVSFQGIPSGWSRIRVIAKGTGPAPILGAGPSFLPLAGGASDAPAGPVDGHDFVVMYSPTA